MTGHSGQKDTKDAAACEEAYLEGCRILQKQSKPNYTAVFKTLRSRHPGLPISYSNLRNRFLGRHQTHQEAAVHQQLLSSIQEEVLVTWIVHLSETGHPISKRGIRKKAEIISGRKPHRSWVYAFLRRNPTIKLGKPSGLDPKRAQAFNRPVVGRHFDLLQALCDKHGIPIENVYNMDEKGCQRGGGRKSSQTKYFVPRRKRPAYKKRSANLELTTIIECVSADGTALLPGFVFSGKEFAPEWFEVNPEICVSMSENGWTDDFLCIEWFKKSFLPQAKARNTSGSKILLIYDGHGSHDQLELIQLAYENGIILLCLPPHTTHKLQPLDVGVFGPFARAWIDRCDEIVEDTGQEMLREDFIKEYMAVRMASFKETTLRAAWRKSGQWPVNRNVFQDDDYAPSVATSTHATFAPASFPFYQSFSDDEIDPDADDDELSDDDTVVSTPIPPLPVTTSSSSSSIPPSLFYARPSYTPTPPARRPRPVGRKRTYEELEKENEMLWERVAQSEAHGVMVYAQLRDSNRKLNAKEGKASKKPKLNVEARCLTSSEGMRLAKEQSDAKAAELKKKQDAQVERDGKEAERERLRRERGTSAIFSGSLNSKIKDDLKDIAYVFQLSLEGSKDEILARIRSHFDAHPTLRDDERYRGLFTRARAQPRAIQPVIQVPFTPNSQPTSSSHTQSSPVSSSHHLPHFPPTPTSLAHPSYLHNLQTPCRFPLVSASSSRIPHSGATNHIFHNPSYFYPPYPPDNHTSFPC